MAITRVTQSMMTQRSLTSLHSRLGALARTSQQMSSGKLLTRPSDSPSGTVTAMRIRSSLADQSQYVRNGQDAQAWLTEADRSLTSVLDQVRRARDLAVQGANTGATSLQSSQALAAEVDQLKAGVLAAANTTYLGRPVFGGITAGEAAYDDTGAFVGTSGAVRRTVADGSKVDVNANGPDVFGPDGANLFVRLDELATALRAGDATAIRSGIDALDAASTRISTAHADLGATATRVDRALQTAQDTIVDMTSSLSDIEDVDLASATVDLQMQQVAYQGALAATARLVQPSLLDFLR